MPTSTRTTPPSDHPTSTPRLLGVRPVLAGLTILAIGVPAVLTLPGPARRSVIPPASLAAPRPHLPASTSPGLALPPAAVTRPTLGPVPLVPKSAAHSPTPSAAPPAPTHSPASDRPATPQPPAWSRSECARLYPHDPIRRAACVSLFTAALTH